MVSRRNSSLMKPRSTLTGSDIVLLQQDLEGRLESVGITTQPEIALRMVKLARDPDAQLQDWAKVIRNDPATSGRLLRLANSAFFAQRQKVTSIDRACLVLGLERLKAVAMGFHLCRAAGARGTDAIARRVWGQSLFRACLACEAARVLAPSLVSEAFVMGLMLDAGVPLMARLLGDTYVELYEKCPSPAMLYKREFDELPYTHVDVLAAIVKRWRLPDLLAKPMEWHHTRPAQLSHNEGPQRLHRIAYVAGLVELPIEADKPLPPPPERLDGLAAGQRVLGVSEEELKRIIGSARTEYEVTSEMFSGVAAAIRNPDGLAEAVHVALAKAVDATLETGLRLEDSTTAERFVLGASSIELHRSEDGAAVAYLFDSRGQRLLAHRFRPADESARTLCEALGVERPASDVLARVQDAIKRLAA